MKIQYYRDRANSKKDMCFLLTAVPYGTLGVVLKAPASKKMPLNQDDSQALSS